MVGKARPLAFLFSHRAFLVTEAERDERLPSTNCGRAFFSPVPSAVDPAVLKQTLAVSLSVEPHCSEVPVTSTCFHSLQISPADYTTPSR